MGTETIPPGVAAGGGHLPHRQAQQLQQQLLQQRQHNQPYLTDGCEGAFGGDPAVKATGDVDTQPQLDVFGSDHPHIHPVPGVGGKLPPVVGIYRPPAARRALKLAGKALHQLAPPAACDNPGDYSHWPADKEEALSAAAESGIAPSHAKDDAKTGPPTESNKCTAQAAASSPPPASDAAAADGSLGGSNGVPGECNSSAVVSPTSARTNRPHRERRPDRAVYIPRARRSLTTPPVTSTVVCESGSKPVVPDTPVATGGGSPTKKGPPACPPRAVEESKGKQKSPIVEVPGGGKSSQQNCDTVIEDSSKRRTGQQPVVEAFKKRSCSLEEAKLVDESNDNDRVKRDRLQIVSEASGELVNRTEATAAAPQSPTGRELFNASCDYQQPEVPEISPPSAAVGIQQPKVTETNDPTMHRNNNRNHRNAKNVATMAPIDGGMIISDRPTEGEKIDRDEKELRRASQEMNRSNRRIMKQTFNSDVLEIDEPAPPTKKPERKVAQNGENGVGGGVLSAAKQAAPIASTITISNGAVTQNGKVSNGGGGGGHDAVEREAEEADKELDGDDEEDWESMYDDNGDCLNPKMLEELTSAVGKVSIEAPHSDYKAFQTKQAVLNEEEFPHVLEVSNFPAEFKTQDLMMLFSQYKESGFDIKWVDDTHALAVFSSSKIAAEVLASGQSFAQVKPLAEATSESRAKARKCASSLQPYRARPETCAALARRLVTTALGVRIKTAPEERENERRVLREAKERKLLAAKQRDEVWDS